MHRIEKMFSGVSVLRKAELSIESGEVHALIGQNGAGKSTMIKILTGVYKRNNGEITFNGISADAANPRESQLAGIATIYQELNLVPMRSVTENINLGTEPKRLCNLFIDWRRAHERANQILDMFGVKIDVKKPLGSYSTAIQQIVAIARAISLDAKLVIMDEPTSSLDDKEVEVLFDVVRKLKSEGVSVLYVSHFLDELFQICDRVTVMRDGETVAVRTIADTSKLELIADMLGRNVQQIESAGMTELGGGGIQYGEELLSTRNMTTGSGLNSFDMDVRRREIVGLGGLLGSGRTEAAKAIFGIDSISAGEIKLKGRSWIPNGPKSAIKDGVGMLPEDRKSEGLIPDMSVRENMTLALLPKLSKFGRIQKDREQQVVSKFLHSLDIKAKNMNQPIKELSGGNQQKVMLARWLATEPDVLILDEPTRGVDVGAKYEIQAIIRQFVDQGFGIILISSEFEELVEGADRIVILQDGKSVATLKNPGITEDSLVRTIAHKFEGNVHDAN